MVATGSTKRVVTYRPSGFAGSFVMPFVLLAIGVSVFYVAILSLRTLEVRCDRAAGTCSIVSSWGPLTTAQPIPLATITGTRLKTSVSKHTYSYEVVLVTAEGDVRLSAKGSGDKAQRVAAKASLDAFLDDPAAATVDVVYDDPSPGLFAFTFLFSAAFSLVGWIGTTVTRVEVDDDARTVDLVTRRWPLRQARLTFPLDAVRDVVTGKDAETSGTETPSTDGCSLVVVVDGEEKWIPISAGFEQPKSPEKARAVNEVRTLVLGWQQPKASRTSWE
jgi:hypothetical protein